ncbi:hypothetical protein AX14_008404 [Amanita brunnescens Koide BX004]|nr:hypothetical protein AX14_008404 [Amanita brunnescens Koide BX004]
MLAIFYLLFLSVVSLGGPSGLAICPGFRDFLLDYYQGANITQQVSQTSGNAAQFPISFKSSDDQRMDDSAATTTWYRGIYHEDEIKEAHKRVGMPPGSFQNVAGDFSDKGGYYMFKHRTDAMYWGNQRALKNDKFALITLTWIPNVVVKTFPYPSITDWALFVKGNNEKTVNWPVTWQAVEGYMSHKIGNAYQPADGDFFNDHLWQLAVVNQLALGCLEIKTVQDFNRDKNWGKNPKCVPKAFTVTGEKPCPTCTIC